MSSIAQPELAMIRSSTVSLPSHEWPQHDERHYQDRYPQKLKIHLLESWLFARFLSFHRQESSALPIANAQHAQWFQLATNTPQISALREIQYGQLEPPRGTTTRPSLNSGSSTASKKGRKLRFKPAVDSRKVSHETRKAKLEEILQPIINAEDPGSSSILLCWGTSSDSFIFPVKVINSDNENGIWQEINRSWYSHRGWWRKYVPLLRVKAVDIVEISIAGKDQRGITNPILRNRYVGMFTKENIRAQKKELEQTIHDYQPQEYPCSYNPSTGETASDPDPPAIKITFSE
ncbi:hypothetical protein ABOM_012250 [Aspergillus bombycis]|uniref:Uncharacterized protein n=1 Tax=Aspergillus bombycis TaxID=109264 RepID=A0A1F7ZIK7_9EURO|nr:hypothetical protein ABOM_012250 [Aspergillus bombycis]OGM39139.1 hypothetical protein ABOM_012250 [Aspergillus bombycis]